MLREELMREAIKLGVRVIMDGAPRIRKELGITERYKEIKGVIITADEILEVIAEGNTKPVKEILKKIGFAWTGEKWIYPCGSEEEVLEIAIKTARALGELGE